MKRRAQGDAKQISVEVHGGDVTLTGDVHSWSEHDLATQSAWCSSGVRRVIDNITVAY